MLAPDGPPAKAMQKVARQRARCSTETTGMVDVISNALESGTCHGPCGTGGLYTGQDHPRNDEQCQS